MVFANADIELWCQGAGSIAESISYALGLASRVSEIGVSPPADVGSMMQVVR